MPSKIVRQKNFERNTRLIRAFCEEYKVDLVELNDGYQMRLEDTLDLYPVRARWHNIKTGERGDWNGYKDLKKLMLDILQMIENTPAPVTEPYTTAIAKDMVIRVEQKLRIVMKPKPKFLTEKMWYKIASVFIYVEKTEPKVTLGKDL